MIEHIKFLMKPVVLIHNHVIFSEPASPFSTSTTDNNINMDKKDKLNI